ncbi:MAG TPA: prepilin-type N-terminal cleavage/methylation domain-containing protein [Caldithrix abyssi]|uniref:Prepilin-type N-terminal cleavage/methylation domain-containing protein n=1 Tax=Caldithrix abyssi TaxID=187145 RepID=A0A7V4U0M5_CALAY|nr:prepilin-type N-terminal cleavage/methylation domain-containing protein [Caldithrix abyssi]
MKKNIKIFEFPGNTGGFTLMELIVVIVIIGVALPAIIRLYSQMNIESVKSGVLDQMIIYAENKMEEITGLKEKTWNWYTNPNQFEVDEDLGDGFQRTVTVSTVSGWGSANLDAWEITVQITHPLYPDGYVLTTRFTKYYEER